MKPGAGTGAGAGAGAQGKVLLNLILDRKILDFGRFLITFEENWRFEDVFRGFGAFGGYFGIFGYNISALSINTNQTFEQLVLKIITSVGAGAGAGAGEGAMAPRTHSKVAPQQTLIPD